MHSRRPSVLLEEEAPLPHRPPHQLPSLPPSELLGASGSGAGSGPALTTTLTRLFSLMDAPCTGVLADDGAHGLVTVLLRLTAEAQFVLHQQGAGIVHTSCPPERAPWWWCSPAGG